MPSWHLLYPKILGKLVIDINFDKMALRTTLCTSWNGHCYLVFSPGLSCAISTCADTFFKSAFTMSSHLRMLNTARNGESAWNTYKAEISVKTIRMGIFITGNCNEMNVSRYRFIIFGSSSLFNRLFKFLMSSVVTT